MGRVTHLYVKEGDRVKKGEIVATIENVQQSANVEGQKATIAAAKTDINSYIAAENTAAPTLVNPRRISSRRSSTTSAHRTSTRSS